MATSAFKKLDPIPQFKATAKLGEFLAQLPARVQVVLVHDVHSQAFFHGLQPLYVRDHPLRL